MKKSQVIEHLTNPPCHNKSNPPNVPCNTCASRFLPIDICALNYKTTITKRKKLIQKVKQIKNGNKFSRHNAQITLLQLYLNTFE